MRVTACSGRRNSDKVGALQANRPLRTGFFTLILNKDVLQAPPPTALQLAHFPTDLGRRLIASALALTSILFVLLLAYWNVLGAPTLG